MSNTTALHNFFGGLQAKLDALKHVQELYEPQLATRFSAFQWIHLNENGLSAQLAYFLDPKQSHAQGDKFLRVFLEYLQDKIPEVPTDLKEVKVRLEAPTTSIQSDRRIDLLLTLTTDEGEFGIGIENKIWASDQKNQLKDYNSYLSKAFGRNYLLIYLTPYTKEVDAHTIPKTLLDEIEGKHFLHLTYSSDFAHRDSNDNTIFTRWIQVCEAEKVRWYLKDLNTYLLQQKFGEQTMETQDTINSYLDKHEGYIDLALKIEDAMLQIKHQRVASFFTEFERRARDEFNFIDKKRGKENGFEFSEDYSKSEEGLYFYVQGWKRHCFAIVFESSGYKWPYYGICTDDPEKHPDSEEIQTRLKSLSKLPELSTNHFPASRYVNQESSQDALAIMMKKQGVDFFINEFKQLYDKLNDYLSSLK